MQAGNSNKAPPERGYLNQRAFLYPFFLSRTGSQVNYRKLTRFDVPVILRMYAPGVGRTQQVKGILLTHSGFPPDAFRRFGINRQGGIPIFAALFE